MQMNNILKNNREKILSIASKYSAKDIRYTCSKDGKAVYAICLGWPEGPLPLQAVCVAKALPEARVQLLGSPEKVGFKVNPDKTLTILPPPLDKTVILLIYLFYYSHEPFFIYGFHSPL